MKVFVYGTLKRDNTNYRLMEEAAGQFIGTTTLAGWGMKDLGDFPAAYPNDRESIMGEIFEVADLDVLDQLEGYPDHFDRTEVKTIHGDAWIYYQEDPQGDPVPLGFW